MLRNRHALDCIAFRPRVLRNVNGTDLTTTFIGTKQRMPVLLAPLSEPDRGPSDGRSAARARGEDVRLPAAREQRDAPGLDEIAPAAGDNGCSSSTPTATTVGSSMRRSAQPSGLQGAVRDG